MPTSPNTTISSLILRTQGIEKLLAEVDFDQATGPDSISCRILKANAGILVPILQVVLPQTPSAVELPRDWLLTYVTPIFKSGDRTLHVNYRHVSLTLVPLSNFRTYSTPTRYGSF